MLGGLTVAIVALSMSARPPAEQAHRPADTDTLLDDRGNGDDWAGYGRTHGEQHFSPLRDINTSNVDRLGLAWSMDLEPGNSSSIPLAVNGVLYFTVGLSIIHAVDAATGKSLWTYDTKVAEHDPVKVRFAWGSRGIAYNSGKVYSGTQDGRLIALDARTGKLVWSVLTTKPNDGRFITGAPRVFGGKIIIGSGGADTGSSRGYVTTYDAETGRQLWRFYIVPGNPADGFEDDAQRMAAKTWTGEWWKYGGGGHAWNAFTYDAETDTILVGTGNGAPWNQHIRSPGGGDNLFLCSIVALDAETGKYKWHYQVNPGETWDYNASMDMALADLTIDGRPRKVVMQAPKNGFFYVIDRITGKLISAEKIAKVSWATKIDLATGRPVEVPGARYPDGKPFELWPSYTGAHSWMPMAYSPMTQMVYIPRLNSGAIYSDKGIDRKNWHRVPRGGGTGAVNTDPHIDDPLQNTSSLLAWDPVRQRRVWEVKTVGGWNGGVLATAGNLVFQGQVDGRFSAYAADSGKELWHFAAQAGITSAPITYRAQGRQYVTLLTGVGTTAGVWGGALGGLHVDSRSQARRVLTFVIGGRRTLPRAGPARFEVAADPDYREDSALEAKGAGVYYGNCVLCHGIDVNAGGYAPDLRSSQMPQSAEAFGAVVRDGALLPNGMPKFDEMSKSDLEALRQFIRSRAAAARSAK